ncbi:putative sodium-coupled neutral amino acid transporter 11 isoform X2 [Acanthaster planci]|uniref:Putative sodium-coupled neutral amino acid transporter 11 n=1 Tax=Acanthaster planci TaxID=133434 RepID=A0A8B7YGR7_ACAPL|nr:putative sodium-coupled neutral amino acid transporter 11 isoform X2 [Acanthaster planci]
MYIMAESPTEKTHIASNELPILNSLQMTSMATHDTAQLVEKGAEASGDSDQKSQEDRSGIPGASFNVANSILGSGIIGLPYAMKKAGLPFGILLLMFIAAVTDYSLLLLIRGGELSGTNTYQGLVQASLGSPGFYFLSFIQFAYPFVAMVGYNVIIGDTITKVFERILSADHVLANRYFIISIITVLISLPFSLYRNVSKLVKVAVVSIVLLAVLIVIIFIRMGTLHIPSTDGAWNFANLQFTESVGIITFAYICHHNSFLVYSSLETPNPHSWSKVTHIAVILATIFSALVGIGGYVTFTGYTQGDVLQNYCHIDDLANVARVVFAITIVCTYPLECFVCREVMENFIVHHGWASSPQPMTRHLILTLVLVGLTLGLSMSTSCLGIVLSINGIIAAVPLVFILPTLCYIRLQEGHWYCREKVPSILICVFGFLVCIFGIVTICVDPSSTHCHSQDLDYCLAVNETSVSLLPTTEMSPTSWMYTTAT